MNCSTPGFPVLHCLLEFAQTHVHWAGDSTQPSHPLSPPSPPALNLSQHQGHFQWVGSLHQVANIGASASVSALPLNSQDWFPLGLTSLISSQSKGLSRVLYSTYSLKALILQCSAFFMVQLSYLYMTAEENIALSIQTFGGKVISLLLNMLPRFFTAFLPRSKHLLILWLQ